MYSKTKNCPRAHAFQCLSKPPFELAPLAQETGTCMSLGLAWKGPIGPRPLRTYNIPHSTSYDRICKLSLDSMVGLCILFTQHENHRRKPSWGQRGANALGHAQFAIPCDFQKEIFRRNPDIISLTFEFAREWRFTVATGIEMFWKLTQVMQQLTTFRLLQFTS